ncbi:MAG: hypothetical protein K8S16_03895 [Bacteroidales bacterium]|nr:hypothetical protein [Bacteroidales bacterium]
MHRALHGGIRAAQAGKFIHNFLSGAIGSLSGSLTGPGTPKDTQVLIAAALSGTAEALGGGKFANGAITGAFVVLFNHLMHPQQDNIETNQNQDKNETNHKREKIDFQESESKTVVQLLKAAKESEDGYIVLEDYFTNIPYNDNALIYNAASVPISFNGNQCFCYHTDRVCTTRAIMAARGSRLHDYWWKGVGFC